MNQSKRALVSVYDKTGLEELARRLQANDVEIVSTSSTAAKIRESGVPVTEVADITGFPEIMGGRVKTLHPMVHGGILGRAEDEPVMSELGIQPFTLVIVNLYPFAETVASGASFEECIEKIDIGGPTMIRAAAKNHDRVGVIVDATDYDRVLNELERDGELSSATRFLLAARAFAHTAAYERAIDEWFDSHMM